MRHTRLNHASDRQEPIRAADAPAKRSPALDDVMSLQASIGNAAVGQLLGARDRASSEQATPVDEHTQRAIDAQSGAGEAMNAPLRAEMQGVAGGPVDDVRLHQGVESDALARSLSATAFTQGRDVFLRSDRDPASARGRATLAHELTHVVRGSVGAGAVLREPDAQPMTKGDEKLPAVVAKIVLDNKGQVDGESHVPGHEGELEFTSLNLGGTRNGSGGIGSGGASPDQGPTTEVEGTRYMDKASAVLAEANVKGDRVVTARFVFVKRGDDGGIQEFLTLEFNNGHVSNYTVAGGDVASEALTFSFEKPK